MLSEPGQNMLACGTIIAVLYLAVCIGKFFYKNPMRDIYDWCVYHRAPQILMIIGLGATIVSWFGLWFESRPALVIGILLMTMIYLISFISLVLYLLCVKLVPFMNSVHERIVEKHEGKRK